MTHANAVEDSLRIGDRDFSLLIASENMIKRKSYSINGFSQNLLQTALLEAKKISNMQQQLYALDTIAYRYSLFEQQQQGDIEKSYLTISTLIEIGKKFIELDREAKGLRTLEESLELSQSIEEEESKISLLVRIAFVYSEIGKPKKAQALLEEILDLYDEHIDGSELETIAFLFNELGEYDRSFEIAKLAGYEDHLIRLASTYDSLGDENKAFAVIDAINTDADKANALTWMAINQTKNGNKEKALEFLIRALKVAQNASSTNENNLEYRSGIVKYELEQYIRNAKGYDLALQAIDIIDNKSIQTTALLVLLSTSMHDKNLPTLNLKIINRIASEIETLPESNIKEDSLATIAIAYGRIGNYDRALSLISQLKQSYTRANTLSYLAEIYGTNQHQIKP